MTFAELLQIVRGETGRKILVPSGGDWSVEEDGGRARIVVGLTPAQLCENMQNNAPASPFYALCFAWWFERATGQPADIGVKVIGTAPTEPAALLHWRRSHFLLAELRAIFGSRFRVDPAPAWTWPLKPVFNHPLSIRSATHEHSPLSEHALEVQISNSRELQATFPDSIWPIARQLPVGLFAEKVAAKTAWTPGGSSQVDLWARSTDGRTVHLIELKTRGNSELGILPEALYYARMMHHARKGRIGGISPAIPALRGAERVVMWLAAPEYHPLVFLDGRTPLAWLNEAMAADNVELRVLPIELADDGCKAWRLAEQWP